ncbi:serine/threonine-protein kinase [Rubrivirga litoralis]|uniref:Serine/threonine-protein kinase n=1 Tax=Rubrivirga litoralis TaxID=3075598 RepID=A0ABU3BRK4_9BACT|nr:serine/threonine-protein kinase [Rubrivirga sp. F394]MDT0631924.1 serine/threonine-protein kinase [Rubrivirga sp. F394]
MALPSPTGHGGPARTGRPPSDADGWLVERLVDLDPAGRARFAERLRAEGHRLATRAERYVRAFDGNVGAGVSMLLSRPAAVAAARLDAPDHPALAPGDVVGAYRVVREIGRGGMGVVYLAERDDLGLRAALKVLGEHEGSVPDASEAPQLDAASEEVQRFYVERRHLAQLSHPGVPRIYDAGWTGAGVPFYAMELVEGLPLDEYANERGLGLVARTRLFAQLCEVVRHVHDRGLAHGDLKPANVLVQDGEPPVENRGSRPVVRLVDFGVSEEIASGSLGDGPRPFTPAFAAPEIYVGGAPSVAADVFALGAVLGDLVASCPEGPCSGGLRRSQPREVAAVPLLDVVARATRPDASERYGSVGDLLADVRRAAVAVAWATLPVVRGDVPAVRAGADAAGRPVPPRPKATPPLWAVAAGAAVGAAVGWWGAR